MAFAEWFNTTFPNACAITFFSIAAWTILLWLIGLIPKLRTLLHYCMPIGAKHFGKYKGYAFITGGASGIGAETARFLAKQGRDLYLCDYNPETLEKVKNELKTINPKIDIITECVDLCKLADAKEFEVFRKKLNSIKIGICFNNAGIAEYNVNRWLRNTPQHLIDLMNIHATVPTLITHAVLAQMLERRNGLMLVMSSGSGICPLEQLPVYGSAKRYVLHFYHCLQKQFPEKKSGVHFHSFHPHFVKTAMTTPLIFTKIPFLFPHVDEWIKYAMRTVRGTRGASAGYLMHEILVWLQRNCAWLVEWSFNYVPGFETLTSNKYDWDERDYASKSPNAVGPIDA